MADVAGPALATGALLSVIGAVLALVLRGRGSLLISCVASVVAGVANSVAGIALVTVHTTVRHDLWSLYPFGTLQVRADSMSGLFLLIIGALSIGIAVYSWGYMAPFGDASLRLYGFLLQLLVLACIGIVIANDLLLFMIAWEAMSILSYLLAALGTQDRSRVDSAFFMLAMSQIGTAAFLLAFLLLESSTHAFGFEQIQSNISAVSLAVRSGAFLLFFFGFGTKAGIVPFQGWLPRAYAAAPSNVSAVLSAILVNMGVYGIIRFAVQLVGVGPTWWGFVVAGIGSLSAILGILYALMERDLKRFLAYSSVENIGIIMIGVGASMVFASAHLHVLAALALIAALFHTLNHATSKGLLFLGVGAIDRATAGQRNMDRLGGLIRVMPWSAGFFLIGALSIAAIPPFNGFISEWLTLESLLQSFHLADIGAKVGMAIAGVFLALTAGLAVTAFVKAFGISFLGMTREEDLAGAREAPRSMRWGMGIVAFEAVALGVLPTSFIPWFARAAAGTYGPNITDSVVPPVYAHPAQNAFLVHLGGALFQWIVPARGPIVLPGYASFAAASPTYLAICFLIGIPVLWLIGRWIRHAQSARVTEVWAGGIQHMSPNYQYTSSSYANPIRIIFGMIFQPGKQAETQFEASEYFRISVSYRAYVVPFFERYVYPAVISLVLRLAYAAKIIQSGSVNLYLAYTFVILIVILVAVR